MSCADLSACAMNSIKTLVLSNMQKLYMNEIKIVCELKKLPTEKADLYISAFKYLEAFGNVITALPDSSFNPISLGVIFSDLVDRLEVLL